MPVLNLRCLRGELSLAVGLVVSTSFQFTSGLGKNLSGVSPPWMTVMHIFKS